MADPKIGDDVKKECLCTGKCGADCEAKDIFYTKEMQAPTLEK